jgi:hypothetical protein
MCEHRLKTISLTFRHRFPVQSRNEISKRPAVLLAPRYCEKRLPIQLQQGVVELALFPKSGARLDHSPQDLLSVIKQVWETIRELGEPL